MELMLDKKPIMTLIKALDTVSEQPVDIDFTLPDYCPDIEKLLKCEIVPKIYNRSMSGGQLRIEGNTLVTVLYTDSEKGRIRACEQSVPFTAVYPVKDVPENYVIETKVKCEYVNCRAMSRRRLAVHGAFSLYAEILCTGKTELFSPSDIENTEFKTENINYFELTSLCSDEFNVGDEIHVSGKPPVEVILNSKARASVTDYKIIPDKLMLNGELSIKILYLSNPDEGNPEQFDYIIPFSQVVDCEGLRDEALVCVNASVMSYEVRLKNDILSENPVVDADARICVSVTAYEPKSAEIVLDTYNTKYCTEFEKKRISVNRESGVISDTIMYKNSIGLNDCDISEIIDFEAFVSPANCSFSGDSIVLNSKLTLCITAFNSDKQPVYIERSMDVSLNLENPINADSVCRADLSVLSLSYRFGENCMIDFRCELKYCILAILNKSIEQVMSISIDEDKPVSKAICPLTVYFADKGENVWSIAKHYHTKKNLIINENSLESDFIEERTPLLILNV